MSQLTWLTGVNLTRAIKDNERGRVQCARDFELLCRKDIFKL